MSRKSPRPNHDCPPHVVTTNPPRSIAIAFLAVLAVIGIFCARRTAQVVPPRPPGEGDVVMYQAMIADLRHGSGYYDAIGGELRQRGYATREIFNLRMPLLMMTLATISDAAGRTILVVLAILLTMATFATAAPGGWRWLSVFMQGGAIALFAGTDFRVMGEPWSGLMVGFSLCAFIAGWRRTAITLGLLALFIRELAAPYCV